MSVMDLRKPVLYSTITFLAYNINLQYYNGLHYTWCTPYFGSNYDSPVFEVAPSSSPLQIYQDLKQEVDGGDLHGTLVGVKRLGIRRGADTMLERGKITEEQRDDIHHICEAAVLRHFRPILCVIPRLEALPYLKIVPVRSRANPLSQEYIVADAPTSSFDVIKIG